jgi:hypothetical protein
MVTSKGSSTDPLSIDLFAEDVWARAWSLWDVRTCRRSLVPHERACSGRVVGRSAVDAGGTGAHCSASLWSSQTTDSSIDVRGRSR